MFCAIWREIGKRSAMEGMALTVNGNDFGAVHAEMGRMDANILPWVSSALLVGCDLGDLHCVGCADKKRDATMRVDGLFWCFPTAT